MPGKSTSAATAPEPDLDAMRATDVAPVLGAQPVRTPAMLTAFRSIDPPVLTKRFALDAKGKLTCTPGGYLVHGSAAQVSVGTPGALAGFIEKMKPSDALAYGVADCEVAHVVACGLLDERRAAAGGDPVIARDKNHMRWPAGPGVLMLDYDPPADGEPLDADALMELIADAAPALRDAPAVVLPSASSYIANADTGVTLVGPRGLRMLVLVADARDVRRAGKVLFDRLVLAGHGRIMVAGEGAMLERGPIDAAVWSPERLDFVAGASCTPPLVQHRPPPMVRNDDAPFFDTRDALPDLDARDRDRLRRVWSELKSDPQTVARARAQRDGWLDRRADDAVRREPGADRAAVRRRIADALDRETLDPSLVLHFADGEDVTVADVAEDPTRFAGRRLADPLEPEYRGDTRIAVVLAQPGRPPVIHSHAHGGRKFGLAAREVAGGGRVGELPVIDADAFLDQYEPPDYVIAPLLVRGQVVALVAHPGVGKSAISLLLALIAAGLVHPPVSSRLDAPGSARVLLLAGENANNLRVQLLPIVETHGVDRRALGERVHIVPDRFPLADRMEELRKRIEPLGPFDLVIVDTKAAFSTVQDENDNVAALGDAHALRELSRVAGGACVLALAHAPKGVKERDALSVRGGGAFIAEIDAALGLWKDDGMVELFALKLRSMAFDPVRFALQPTTTSWLDRRGRPVQSVIAKLLDDNDVMARTQDRERGENALMRRMIKHPTESVRGWARSLYPSVPEERARSRVTRTLRHLEKAKLVQKHGRRWTVSTLGQQALADEGDDAVPEGSNRPRNGSTGRPSVRMVREPAKTARKRAPKANQTRTNDTSRGEPPPTREAA